MALNHRVAKYILQDSDDVIESCPQQIICVLDLLIHLPHFYRILNEANYDDIPETACSELTDGLKIIFDQSMTYGLESTINVKPLILKMERRDGGRNKELGTSRGGLLPPPDLPAKQYFSFFV